MLDEAVPVITPSIDGACHAPIDVLWPDRNAPQDCEGAETG